MRAFFSSTPAQMGGLKRTSYDEGEGEGEWEADRGMTCCEVTSGAMPASKRLRPTCDMPTGECPICRSLLINKCVPCKPSPTAASLPRHTRYTHSSHERIPHRARAGNQCLSWGPQSSPCTLSFGSCGCVFHEHCLSHWLRKRPVCPLHESQWQPCAPRMCPALTGNS